jgi:hypothetical protein
LNTLGVLLSPVELLREDLIGIVLARLARSNIGSVRQGISEQSLDIR